MLALVILAAGLLAPHGVAFAQRLEFEVASVKRNTTGGPRDTVPRRSGDLVLMHNASPYHAICYAWRLEQDYEIANYTPLPEGWNRYDFDARVGRSASDDEVRRMMQSLLQDRFQLKVHREMRPMPLYELTAPKGRHNLRRSDSQEVWNVILDDRPRPHRPGRCITTIWRDGAHMVCHSAPMTAILTELSGLLKAPVADRTGLTGTYDLHVHFIADDDALNDTGPTLVQAVQDSLGLKLENGRGQVEVVVIDHLERPLQN